MDDENIFVVLKFLRFVFFVFNICFFSLCSDFKIVVSFRCIFWKGVEVMVKYIS